MKLDFEETYVLEGEGVRLSPLLIAHTGPLEILSKDPDIWTFFLEKGQGGTAFQAYIRTAFQQRARKQEYPFVVFDKRKQAIAGMTRLYAYSAELRTIKLGHTWYGKDFRGSGLNKRCKYLLFEFAFEQLAVERIGFGAYASNMVSLAALKSVGCQQEGALRNFFPALQGEGREDCVLYSMLREEWLSYAKAALQQKLPSSGSKT